MEVLKTLLSARQAHEPGARGVAELLSALAGVGQLDCILCSPGGVGSTALNNFLQAHGLTTNLLTDQDGVRHAPRPPPQLPGDACVVYLFGDPLATVASHYRRGIAWHQAVKTSRRALDQAAFPPDFAAYLRRGEDLFGLAQHWHSWLHQPTPYPVLFCRYERLFERPVAAALFTYICRAHCGSGSRSSGSSSPGRQPRMLQRKSGAQVAAMAAEFAALQRPRASAVSAEQRARGLYAGLAAEMDAAPAIFLRSPDAQQRRNLLAPAAKPGC